MTLHALRSATNPQSTSDEYVPTYDEGVVYQERLQQSDYTETGLSDDLDAAGWESVTVRDNGGTPVTFGSD